MENLSIINFLIIRGFLGDFLSIITNLIGLFLIIAQHNRLQNKILIKLKEFYIFYNITFLFSLIFLSLKFIIFLEIDFMLNFFTILIFLYNLILKTIIKHKKIPSLDLIKPDFKDYNKGTINLGTVFYKREILRKFKLNIEDLKRHILIYGQTGTGKTTFLNNFLHHFEKLYPNINFILFEFKGEYGELMKDVESINVIRPGLNFFFNPFDNDIFPKENYVEILFDALKSCQIIESNSDFSPQMEKVLIDALRIVCSDENKQSWENFFKILNIYSKKKKNDIPQLKQTIISITNRLRRYYDGPLKCLFDFSSKTKKISGLLKQNCIIDLGSILNLGGSKEDVIFFANLVLKWIWEYNMKKKPTNELEHLTIFEDASYIASKKMLETTKISTYLEDIAMLLRGKGEALITLTTTLDISKNIIRNSGSKFFFKFNEKNEDVIHYLGFRSNFPLKANELTTGYCLAKIDSIPDAFLLKIKNTNKKISSKGGPTYLKEVNDLKLKKSNVDSKKINSIEVIENKQEVPATSLQEINRNFKNDVKQAEILYKKGKYEQCVRDVFLSYKKLIQEYRNFIKIPEFYNIKSFYEKLTKNFYWKYTILCKNTLFYLNLRKKYNRTKIITLQEASKSLDKLNSIFHRFLELTEEPSKNFNKIDVLKEKKNIFNQKMKSEKEIGIYNIRLYYFHRIIGPEIYYQIGSTIANDEIEKQIPKYMDVNMGELNVSIKNYQIYINIFEIESNWARGNKELLELVIFYDKEKNSEREMPKEIINLVRNFINKLKSNQTRYIAFYNENSEELKENRDLITREAQSLKYDLTEFHRKINKIKLMETAIKNNSNFDPYNFKPIFTKIEKEIQKLLIKENSHSN
jgi:nucleoside-triphosphatase THEP1